MIKLLDRPCVYRGGKLVKAAAADKAAAENIANKNAAADAQNAAADAQNAATPAIFTALPLQNKRAAAKIKERAIRNRLTYSIQSAPESDKFSQAWK